MSMFSLFLRLRPAASLEPGTPPDGWDFLVTSDGLYITDESGNFIIVPIV